MEEPNFENVEKITASRISTLVDEFVLDVLLTIRELRKAKLKMIAIYKQDVKSSSVFSSPPVAIPTYEHSSDEFNELDGLPSIAYLTQEVDKLEANVESARRWFVATTEAIEHKLREKTFETTFEFL